MMTVVIPLGLTAAALMLVIWPMRAGLGHAAGHIWRIQRLRWPSIGPLRRVVAERLRAYRPVRPVAVTEVRDLVVRLQLRLSMGQTLAVALLRTAEQGRRHSPFGRRLYEWTRAKGPLEGPEKVLEKMAEEFKSPELADVCRKLEAARRGDATYVEALRFSAQRMDSHIRGALLSDIRRWSSWLVVPLGGILLVVLVLLLYPTIAQLLDAFWRFAGSQ